MRRFGTTCSDSPVAALRLPSSVERARPGSMCLSSASPSAWQMEASSQRRTRSYEAPRRAAVCTRVAGRAMDVDGRGGQRRLLIAF
jgi:hypothetical protein